MDSLENLRKRLEFNGGTSQQSRMINDKLTSLKRSLLYSYQAGNIVIKNPNYDEKSTDRINKLEFLKFRGLMNPDKLNFDEDKKMLSIPFEDICLNAERAGKTSDGLVPIPIKTGDVFLWEDTDTRWLVTLQYLEELAYFRADVRKCYPFPLDIDGEQYWFSSTGENQETLDWQKKKLEEWNKENYTRILYIKRDKTTFDFFKRFKIIKVPNIFGELESWEVQAVNPNKTGDVLLVHLKEYFENKYEEISKEEQEKIKEQNEIDEVLEMYVYGTLTYQTKKVEGALWEIKNNTIGLKFEIDAVNMEIFSICTIESMSGRSGEFDLYYNGKLEKHVIVKPLMR